MRGVLTRKNSHIIPLNSYSHCIKQESGFCCIQYQTCASETMAMSLNAQETKTKVDGDCTSDYIGIPGESIIILKKLYIHKLLIPYRV